MCSIYVKIGNNIKQYRKKINMTQEQVADKMNLSGNYYGKVERGIYNLSYNIVSDLYKELGWDIDFILTGKSKPENPFASIMGKCPQKKRNKMADQIIWVLRDVVEETDKFDELTKKEYLKCLNVGHMCFVSYTDEIAEDTVLYNIRKNEGYSSQKMAEKLSLPVRSYTLVEKGKSKPKADTFVKINDIFGMNPSFVIDGKFENLSVVNEIWNCLDVKRQENIMSFLQEALKFLLEMS